MYRFISDPTLKPLFFFCFCIGSCHFDCDHVISTFLFCSYHFGVDRFSYPFTFNIIFIHYILL